VESVRDDAEANDAVQGTITTVGGRKSRIRSRVRGRWVGIYLFNDTKDETWAINSLTGVVKEGGRIKN
jgi:hypothetical protein